MARRIPLHGKHGRGLFAIVDDEDFELVNQYRWTLREFFGLRYAQAQVNGRTVFMHRLINETPDGLHTDHIDHDGLNNTRANLRTATPSQNCHNRRPRGYRQGRRFKGVHSRGRRYFALVTVEGERLYLGMYPDRITAALAYDNAARALVGEYARLNLPDTDPSRLLPPADKATVQAAEEWEARHLAAAMARDVAEGVPPKRVARLYRVVLAKVIRACEDHGVRVPPSRRVPLRVTTPKAREALRLVLFTDLNLAQIGQEAGCSHEYARLIRDRAFLAGLLPVRNQSEAA